MRVFVAVDLPANVKKLLGEAVTELSACRADVRWVRPESMHLTLKFLGDVEPREIAAIDEVLSRVAGAAQPTRGRLRNLGSFPHLSRPRVLWAGLEITDDSLAQLHAGADKALQEIGFPKERQGFNPHITIGRVRSARRLEELRQAVKKLSALETPEFTIDELALFESRLHKSGARYTVLSTHALGAVTHRQDC